MKNPEYKIIDKIISQMDINNLVIFCYPRTGAYGRYFAKLSKEL
jgi:hypothetical protein